MLNSIAQLEQSRQAGVLRDELDTLLTAFPAKNVMLDSGVTVENALKKPEELKSVAVTESGFTLGFEKHSEQYGIQKNADGKITAIMGAGSTLRVNYGE